MRLISWLLVLAACGAQSPPVASPYPVSQAPAVKCPVCVQATCPQAPACPEPPSPPEPPDWHCFDWQRPDKPVSAYCRPNARACEAQRRVVIALKVGTIGPCATQRLAFCFLIVDAVSMSQQRACARSLENCDERREWAESHVPEKTYNVGPCAPTVNGNSFPFPDEKPPVDPFARTQEP